MKLLYKIILIACCTLFTFSCTDQIETPTDFESKVFIFGNITNKVDYVYLVIGKTVPLNNTSSEFNATSSNPVNNAVISLFTKDINNNTALVTNNFTVTNGENGDYKSARIITPILNNYYWVEVIVDGVTYKSSQELLKKPIAISNITKKDAKIKLSFSDPADEINHYLAYFSFYDTSNNFISRETELSNDVLFDGNANAFIETYEIYDSNYQTVATLVHLNFETYQFYLNVFAQNRANEGIEEDGGNPSRLFAAPPANLTGNILNTATNRYALGNFGVVSVSDEFTD